MPAAPSRGRPAPGALFELALRAECNRISADRVAQRRPCGEDGLVRHTDVHSVIFRIIVRADFGRDVRGRAQQST